MRSSNLRHWRATQRSKDWVNTRGELAGCAPPPEAERQAGNSQSLKAAISAPETASSAKLRAGSKLLTKSSWDPGWLTSAGRVTARDQLPRRDTRHTWNCAPAAYPGNWAAGMGEVIRCTAPPEECALQAPGRLSCSDRGRTQNTGPTESVPLCSTREPEPEWLRPGKWPRCRARFRQFPWRATWSLSSWESTHAVSRGKTSVVETLRTLPTHTSEICLQCSSLPTARLNKWA